MDALEMDPRNIVVRVAIWFAAAVPFMTLSALSIAGAAVTSPGLQNIYLGQVGGSGTGVRFGYLGLCAYVGPNKVANQNFQNTNGYDCLGRPYTNTPAEIASLYNTQEDIITLAQDLQNDFSIVFLCIGVGFFMIGWFSDSFAWCCAGLQRAPNRYGMIAMPALWFGWGFSLAAAACLTTGLNNIETAMSFQKRATTNVQIQAGHTIEGLEWGAWGFANIFAFAIYYITRDAGYGFDLDPVSIKGSSRGIPRNQRRRDFSGSGSGGYRSGGY